MPATRGRKKKLRNERRKKLNQPERDDGWRQWLEEGQNESEDRVSTRRRAWAIFTAATTATALAASAFYALESFVLAATATVALIALFSTAASSAAVPTAASAAVTTQPDVDPAAARACTATTTRRHRFDPRSHTHTTTDTDTSNADHTRGMMFRIARLVEAIQTVRRSVLDYSYAATSSLGVSAVTPHALLTDEATVERHKQQQQQQQVGSSIVIAPAFQPHEQEPQDDGGNAAEQQHEPLVQQPPPGTLKPKKKRKTRGRAESMYTSTVTIEEFTVLPARRRSSIASFDEYMDVPERHHSFVTIEEYTVLPARRPNAITTPAVAPVVAGDIPAETKDVEVAPVVSGVTQQTPVESEQLRTETPTTTPTTTPKKPRTRRRSKSVRIETSDDAVAAESVETPMTETSVPEVVGEIVEVAEPVAEFTALPVESSSVESSDTAESTDAADAQDDEIADMDVALSKSRRRRHSRRRSRSRRSTLSLSERPSCCDEFLLLEPALAKATAPTVVVVDKNRALYVAEAARARALQAAPIDTAHITTPAIRLMVDELNAQLARTHATLADNWDFLASLTPEATEPEPEAACCGRPHKLGLSLDSTEVDDDDLVLRDSELDDDDTMHFGDVDYDDHYYSFHSMSTPCV